jgi:hypothetical protein
MEDKPVASHAHTQGNTMQKNADTSMPQAELESQGST